MNDDLSLTKESNYEHWEWAKCLCGWALVYVDLTKPLGLTFPYLSHSGGDHYMGTRVGDHYMGTRVPMQN